jgi:hypothetical protein
MLWRHLCLVRSGLAAGLVSGVILVAGSLATAADQPGAPRSSEPSAAPIGVATDTLDILRGSEAGDLAVVARGHGADKVRISIRNASKRRLNVILPPGLVAASAVGQGPAGGGRGGLQSMGLGSVTNREGAFGEFQGGGTGGLQSVGLDEGSRSHRVTVPVGETVDFNLPSVCLNFGLPSPTGRNTLKLMDVDDYSKDPRVRRALRSLATFGTSHGVAQAVMWNVCNDLPFPTMLEQGGRVMNAHEIALAARFVEELGSRGSDQLLDPASLSGARLFVQVRGEGSLDKEARRLSGQLAGLRLLGLPLQVADSEEPPVAGAPALYLRVVLNYAKTGDTRGRVLVSACSSPEAWEPLGNVSFRDNSSISVLDGATLAKVIDRAVASSFVKVAPARRTLGSTTLKVDNRLPFTVTNLIVKAGNSSGSPSVPFEAVGVGPGRSILLPIQAATASLVEHVELNGL